MMVHSLNLTLPIKQDAATLKQLQQFKADFATKFQPDIDDALRNSKIVHFARVVVIHDKFIQVITEYDGDPKEYTDFFREALPKVFEELFLLTEGAPPFGELDKQSFFELSAKLDPPSLGQSTGESKGYLFSAYGDRTVAEILSKLA